jgi:hypothetical protein
VREAIFGLARLEAMRMQRPTTIAFLTTALALFVAGFLLAAYAAGWPRGTEPQTVLITLF